MSQISEREAFEKFIKGVDWLERSGKTGYARPEINQAWLIWNEAVMWAWTVGTTENEK